MLMMRCWGASHLHAAGAAHAVQIPVLLGLIWHVEVVPMIGSCRATSPMPQILRIRIITSALLIFFSLDAQSCCGREVRGAES